MNGKVYGAGMEITIRYTTGCPHVDAAERNVREALRTIGMDAVIEREVVSTAAEASRLGFLGSPTILVDGTDPFAAPASRPGLACRLYGGGKYVPDVQQLSEALVSRT